MISDTTNTPFWGPTTANSNFCEEDYVITRYIAEFINTLTNLSYILYAIYGLRRLHAKPNVHVFRLFPYWGLMAVGICSAAFHISMKYHTQMMDDLSMLFATTPVLHRVITVHSSHRDSVRMAVFLGTLLSALVVYHVLTDELIFHSVSFGVMVVIIGLRTMQLIGARTKAGSESRRKVWGVVRFGAVIFNAGYYLWLIDNWTCGILKSWKETIGLPWAFVLELHGWWHIFTAMGAYIFIAVVDQLVSGDDLEGLERELAWPAPWAATSAFAGRKSVEEKRE
ncbi:alkaline ceramidase family protein [Aspergillus steynii IBT 23096]|uniref:Alkaline ceramidase family protein n=1 Tax=Aspergillus steynii IBT 23096 TaxID=1392250 RepID=A0A2I2FRV1_9EURO|nr:alkaline ceramidase family protein [Aspergillus steynii IBT 23096]PLB43362.1 alkaline ceramidase family protein [Aspergillus steynii IBT 23096]